MERLQKVIAQSGIASRRKAEELIVAGKVKVNGTIITELGTKVSPQDEIFVDGKLVEKELKESLLEAMKEHNITSWASIDGSIKAVYRAPSTRTTIDSARLKKELPDVAEEYSKTSNVKDSVSLTIEI